MACTMARMARTARWLADFADPFQEGNTQDNNKKHTTQLDVLKMLPTEH